MPRPSWKGFIRLGLVSVPVEAYPAAASEGGKVQLNQIHEDCGSRIKYVKTCPIHGIVPNEEIVRGYEYQKDQYALIDPEEVDKLRTEADKSINIDCFFDPEELEPMYFSGQNYYLTPSGRAGEKPYALLQEVMSHKNRYCAAQVVISGKEQLVILRAVDNMLVMSTLKYESELKKATDFKANLGDGEFTKKELGLTESLVEATTEEFDVTQYNDLYSQRLHELIEAKIEGKEVIRPPEAEGPPEVINLAEALAASVKQMKSADKRAARKNHAPAGKRKMAASAKARKSAQLKKGHKKTG